jgi:radical SAM-linked protein
MSEIRQRWRLVFARDEEARYLSHLDAVKGWERAFRRGEIPVATSEGFSPRPKLVFAAPLQLGMLAEHELADLFLAEKLTAPDLRARLVAGIPRGYRVLDLHDVWIGAAALAPRLAAADYRMTLLNVEQARLADAAARLMAAERLQRERHKEARTITYDLRALVLTLRVGSPEPAALPPAALPPAALPPAALPPAALPPASGGIEAGPIAAAGLWMRLRHSQSLGSGRADEVVATLADEMGMAVELVSGAEGDIVSGEVGRDAPATPGGLATQPPLEVLRPVRERLWLAEELEQ